MFILFKTPECVVLIILTDNMINWPRTKFGAVIVTCFTQTYSLMVLTFRATFITLDV